jgi:hypothetical protein
MYIQLSSLSDFLFEYSGSKTGHSNIMSAVALSCHESAETVMAEGDSACFAGSAGVCGEVVLNHEFDSCRKRLGQAAPFSFQALNTPLTVTFRW